MMSRKPLSCQGCRDRARWLSCGFMYKDGEAVWTYVDVPYANIGYYAITGCERKGTQVKAGDVVITSGNLNLADGTQVHVKRNER